jgi:hypothetical protein
MRVAAISGAARDSVSRISILQFGQVSVGYYSNVKIHFAATACSSGSERENASCFEVKRPYFRPKK